MLDVLPRALVAAAVGVRAYGRDLEGVQPVDRGDPGLTAALRDFCTAWSGRGLQEAAEACAADLEAAAAEYVDVESLLVPVALR